MGEGLLKQLWHDNMDELVIEIDEKRNKMIAIAMDSGLNSKETIKCSQELDSLLNQYERIKMVNQKDPFFSYNFINHLYSCIPKHLAKTTDRSFYLLLHIFAFSQIIFF